MYQVSVLDLSRSPTMKALFVITVTLLLLLLLCYFNSLYGWIKERFFLPSAGLNLRIRIRHC